jgi:molybdopterin converting factor subunit 1
MNEIKVLFFSTFRDRVGEREINIEIPEEFTVSQVKILISEKYPSLGDNLDFILVAINKDFAFDDDLIPDNAELAFFPPVSGGSDRKFSYQIIEKEIKLDEIMAEIRSPEIGATSFFVGTVRDYTASGGGRETEYLEYEAFTEMAERKMKEIGDEIKEKWTLIERVYIVQRIGKQFPQEISVVVACNSSHRNSGIFEAAKFGIDRLKQIVPVWKKEVGPNGEEWIEGDFIPQKEIED